MLFRSKELRRALQVVNMTQTGNRLGMCPVFIGMRVRLTAKISAKYKLVQDACGVVVGVCFDEREFTGDGGDWRVEPDHPARRRGYVKLRYMPRGIMVKFDEFTEDVGMGFGVVLVRPQSSDWDYKYHVGAGVLRVQDTVRLQRVQLPLAPECVRTAQTSQGLSMDAAIMMLTRPGNMSREDWWLHVYVMLSRVRTAEQLLIFGLPSIELFEQGPPEFVRVGISLLKQKSLDCASKLHGLARDYRFPTCYGKSVADDGLAMAPCTVASEHSRKRVCTENVLDLARQRGVDEHEGVLVIGGSLRTEDVSLSRVEREKIGRAHV